MYINPPKSIIAKIGGGTFKSKYFNNIIDKTDDIIMNITPINPILVSGLIF